MTKKTRGRPKEYEDDRIGYTFRMTTEFRQHVIMAALEKTALTGDVVSMHDVLHEAVTDYLRRHRFPV